MELIFEGVSIVDRADTTRPSTCRITALNYEARYEAMEYGVGIVAIQTVLEEISTSQRTLFCEDFELDVAGRCVEDDFGRWLRFEVVEGGHVILSLVGACRIVRVGVKCRNLCM